jgi:hypothetical protein
MVKRLKAQIWQVVLILVCLSGVFGCTYVKHNTDGSIVYINFARKLDAQASMNGDTYTVRIRAGVDPMTGELLQQGIEIGKMLSTIKSNEVVKP